MGSKSEGVRIIIKRPVQAAGQDRAEDKPVDQQ
mgnify:CR=1 FL=1